MKFSIFDAQLFFYSYSTDSDRDKLGSATSNGENLCALGNKTSSSDSDSDLSDLDLTESDTNVHKENDGITNGGNSAPQ